MGYTWALPFNRAFDFIGAKTAHTLTTMQSRKSGPTSSANAVSPKPLSEAKGKDPAGRVLGAGLPTEGRMRGGPGEKAGFLDARKVMNKSVEVEKCKLSSLIQRLKLDHQIKNAA